MDAYTACPNYETEHYLLRLVQESDAEALLKCYSDPKAQKLFNADNCTNDFSFSTLTEMRDCIKFWIAEYNRGSFVRWAITDRIRGNAVGTIEMFCDPHWPMIDGKAGGCLRIDILPQYETNTHLSEILQMANDEFFTLFSAEFMLVKAIPEATERIAALKENGFVPFELSNPEFRHYYAKTLLSSYPGIIKVDSIKLVGTYGSGGETAKVYDNFESSFGVNPFASMYTKGYEVRLYDGTNAASRDDLFVGILSDEYGGEAALTPLVLPASNYAVFEVHVSNGYDSENATMDKWLSDHAARYGQRELDGLNYSVLVYDERFRNTDPVIEVWLPIIPLCQSCSMPMANPEDFGTETNGCRSTEYCRHCYNTGAFTKDETMEEMIESCIPFSREYYGSDEAARKAMLEHFPKLKRWARGE